MKLLPVSALSSRRPLPPIAEADLTGTRADALRQDILLNEQFSVTERQAALDLVEATGRYSDLESSKWHYLKTIVDLLNNFLLSHLMHKQKRKHSCQDTGQ